MSDLGSMLDDAAWPPDPPEIEQPRDDDGRFVPVEEDMFGRQITWKEAE